MRNKKLIPFEIIEKAVAEEPESYKRGLTALQSTHQDQRWYSRPFESTAYQSYPAIPFWQVVAKPEKAVKDKLHACASLTAFPVFAVG